MLNYVRISHIFVLLFTFSQQSFADGMNGLPDFTKMAETNSPAVVNIKATPEQKEPSLSQREQMPRFGGPDGPGRPNGPFSDFFRYFYDDRSKQRMPPRPSQGSGFIVSKDGYIITNHHVVDGAGTLTVTLSDRREIVAKLIGSDERSDVAVLKIEVEGELPVVRFGSSEELKVGEWVLAIGSPFGFDYSVTAGIVSAKSRSLPQDNYVPFIQTDVAINPGNSGGPLFNMKGEVVGVNSQIYSRTGGFMGLSFSIPVDVVLNVYNQIKTSGTVSRGWLGVVIQDVTQELAESFGMQKPAGALVSKVIDNSPAKKGGIKVGDIIIVFSDVPVSKSSDLPPLVGKVAVDTKVKLDVLRKGRKTSLKVRIGALKDESLAVVKPEEIGSETDNRLNLAVQELTVQDREVLDVPKGGVIVREVMRGPAFAAGIRVGDVILEVANKKVLGFNNYSLILRGLKKGSVVPVLVSRQKSPLYIALRIPVD
jgi:serine protease Do